MVALIRGTMKKGYGLIVNFNKPNAVSVAKKIVAYLNKQGKAVWIEEKDNKVLGLKKVHTGSFQKVLQQSSLFIALGGDGTILNLVRQMKGRNIPVFGVNLGGLGFLTEVPTKNLNQTLNQLIRKKYTIESRLMLDAKVLRKRKPVEEPYLALNDIVITNGALARVIDLNVSINNEPVTAYSADGLIFATPTGSTAYSLSSGGPIVHPSAKVILMTPVSPHTLTNRPLVITSDMVVNVRVSKPGEGAYLTVDGQVGLVLKANDVVQVKKSSKKARLVILQGNTYFDTLSKKLSWGHFPVKQNDLE